MSGMNWSLNEIASILDLSQQTWPAVKVQRVVTDSRVVQPGDLFVVLAGSRVDAHEFLPQVAEKGAVAALVMRPMPDVALPQLLVQDSVAAMQRLAQAWRQQQPLSACIAVTGSNGKTSVKEMLAAVWRAGLGNTLATQGNLNNHLGLPMTLLELRAEHQAAVLEIGANHVGEIAQLAPLAAPTMAMITSIGLSHVGEFGSLERIIQAKSELLSALMSDGIAILPVWRDVVSEQAWRVWSPLVAGKTCVVFGDDLDLVSQHEADAWVCVQQREMAAEGQWVTLLSSHWGEYRLHLPLLGAHQARNLAGVVAASLMKGVTWQQIQQGLHHVSLPKGRVAISEPLPGLQIIDDSYNANPTSMLAAIAVLKESQSEQHLLVIGSMGELGDEASVLHQQVVCAAVDAGVDKLWAMGEFADAMAEVAAGKLTVAVTAEEIAQAIWTRFVQQPSLTVLVKGSRSSRMERVVESLLAIVEAYKKEKGAGEC